MTTIARISLFLAVSLGAAVSMAQSNLVTSYGYFLTSRHGVPVYMGFTETAPGRITDISFGADTLNLDQKNTARNCFERGAANAVLEIVTKEERSPNPNNFISGNTIVVSVACVEEDLKFSDRIISTSDYYKVWISKTRKPATKP